MIYPIEINMYNMETQSLNFMGSHVEYLKVRSWALFYLILLLMILMQLQKNWSNYVCRRYYINFHAWNVW